MSSYYYLVSQLPSFSLKGNTPLPITEAHFTDLCTRFLDTKEANLARTFSLEPPKEQVQTVCAFVNAWYDWERMLRFALAQIRAAKLKKEFILHTYSLSADIVQIARTAVGMNTPLEAEDFLNEQRCAALEAMRPIDAFSLDAVFYYALKLKLALRMRKFNTETGMESYRTIYDRILGEST
ncbi:hypothetical protein [Treponema lecithinolyticum]|uniref:DUF2764 domain-containing protein n=1 Tax=Treponema lecithinolyticum ATCC 700332 TaxID=1321815 RepID=A0ABN0P1Y2_TRELE|nr:hypothetical protein [Treponema lecithinolyticum]ERJ94509.1 hypothetical protein HMPREF9193_00042 [Treponema lecithinolyticum ATCC 700332]